MKLLSLIFLVLILVSPCSANQAEFGKVHKPPVKLIVIDPGFGGNENGAVGCNGKVFAKDINLEISKKVTDRIKNDLKIEAILTRNTDAYLSLEERTTFANTRNADLFVSIHLNSVNDTSVNGIETYCLNIVAESKAIKNAAIEESTSSKNTADMTTMLFDLMENAKINESTFLANSVQSALFKQLSSKYDHMKDRGVKHAPFYVLLTAEMPSIVVQVSFISNPDECKRLITESYQEDISLGIVQGIKRHIEDRNK